MRLLMLLIVLLFNLKINATNYLDYYKTINNAEVLFTQNNYLESLKLYDFAFENFKPFARDAYNAAVISFKIKDKKKAQKYLLLSLQMGLRISSIKKELLNLIDVSFRTEKNLNSIFNIDSLFDLDQKIRLENGGFKNNENKQIDNKIQECLKKYIIKHGIPDEREIGCHYPYDKFKLLLSHGILWFNDTINDIFLNAVLTGKMHPQNYASLYDFNKIRLEYKHDTILDLYYYFNDDLISIHSKKYRMKYSSNINHEITNENIEIITKRRERIGLQTPNISREILKYKIKNDMLFIL